MITHRREFIQKMALASGMILTPWQKVLAGLFTEDPAYKLELLRRNVGAFTERGGTIGYLISTDGIVVVDTQFPEQAQHLIGEIKKRTEKKIDLLVNTHHHGDHTAGNIAFKGLVNKVVAHENSKKNQQRQAVERNAEATQLYPDTLYQDKWSQKVGDEIISLRYFGAAHTNGDSVVHFENANVAHLGDLIFNRRHPFVDRPGGASINNWIKVLEKIQEEYDDETLFIFGHAGEGHPITGEKKDIKAMQHYLQKVLDVVSTKIKEGQSLEEVLALTEIPGASEWKGDGIQRPLTAAFEELSEQ